MGAQQDIYMRIICEIFISEKSVEMGGNGWGLGMGGNG